MSLNIEIAEKWCRKAKKVKNHCFKTYRIKCGQDKEQPVEDPLNALPGKGDNRTAVPDLGQVPHDIVWKFQKSRPFYKEKNSNFLQEKKV